MTRKTRRHGSGLAWVALLSLVSPALGAGDQGITYQATSDYALRLGEETIAGAEVFYSPRQVAYLVISDRLTRPLIVRIPEETVVEISPEAVERDPREGIATVAPGTPERGVGGFERRLKEIRFQLGDTPAALVPASPIIGWHTPQTLRSENLVLRSGFARAGKSQLDVKAVVIPPPHQELLVEVFFGSWDDYSQLVMPAIMRLDEQLSSSSVQFRYYGLPRRLADDPVGAERSIHGVPTMIVSADGAELGRLVGRALFEPTESLTKLLSGELE